MRHMVLGLLSMALLVAAAAGCRSFSTRGAPAGSYWIQSKSGKTHNSTCRYFGRCKGYLSAQPTTDNCRICGGGAR